MVAPIGPIAQPPKLDGLMRGGSRRDARPRAIRMSEELALLPRPAWRAAMVVARAPTHTRRYRKALAKLRRYVDVH